jgi:hypothetical protein
MKTKKTKKPRFAHKGGCLLAWAPIWPAPARSCVRCKIVEIHGTNWSQRARLTVKDFNMAFKVELEFPDGQRFIFPGPMAHANGKCRPCDVPELVELMD